MVDEESRTDRDDGKKIMSQTGKQPILPIPRKPSRASLVAYNQIRATVGAVATIIPLPKFLRRECIYVTCSLFAVSFLAVLFVVFCGMSWTYKHTSCFMGASARSTAWALADTEPRTCPPVSYPTMAQSNLTLVDPSRVCLVSLTDGAPADGNFWQNLSKCRNFDSIGSVVRENHAQYAQRHGHRYTMEEAVLDSSRPPAWSKIKAVQGQLESGKCDWVMWLDADVVFMNQSVRLETLLSSEENVDLIVTPDASFRVSSGVWLIRNSAWSQKFLQDWWNMRRFVRSKGLSLSGDNNAFGSLVSKRLKNDSEREHLHITPERCSMNSNAIFVNDKQVDVATKRADWQGSTTSFHQGDFIAHAAGIDQKLRAIEQLMWRVK